MKYLVLFISFFSTLAAEAGLPNLSPRCSDIEAIIQADDGSMSFQATGVSILLFSSSTGSYGYAAQITSPQGTYVENDVKMQLLNAPSPEVDSLKDLVSLVHPNLQFSDIAKVLHANIGTKANQEDSGGIHFFELHDQDDQILGKLVQMGWSFGRCK